MLPRLIAALSIFLFLITGTALSQQRPIGISPITSPATEPSSKKRGRPLAMETMQEIAIRLPMSLIRRLDALVERMRTDALIGLRTERSTLMRSLVQEGVEKLEAGYAEKDGKKK